MPKRERSATMVDFMEPPARLQRMNAVYMPATQIATGQEVSETTPIESYISQEIILPPLAPNPGQITNTQESVVSEISVLPAIPLNFSLSSDVIGNTTYEETPSTIEDQSTQSSVYSDAIHLTGDSAITIDSLE